MNNQSNNYCQAMVEQSVDQAEDNRRVILLMLLAKLGLILLIGVIYAVSGS